MNIRSRRDLRQHAAQALAAAPADPRKIVLIYGGVACGLSLICTVISYILSIQISETGGLSSMGLRSILSTAKYVLPFVQLAVTMGMELGYVRVTLNISRGRPAAPDTLLEGYRRFGPLLRTVLLQSLIICGVAIAAMYLSTYIFMLLPVSEAFYEAAAPMLESMSTLDPNLVLDDATLIALTEAMVPMLWIFAAVFFIAVIPILYSYRMTYCCLADDPRPGALAAMRQSRWMLHRNRLALFRLDLSFWWYYLLQMLITVVAYGDQLLPLAGVSLPWSNTVSYFLFYVLSLILQLAVYYFFTNRVQVTYAAAYDTLKPQSQSPAAM